MSSYRQALGTISILGVTIAFSSCALMTSIIHPGSEKPVGKVGRLGALFCPADSGLKILEVDEKSPAGKAGVKIGDVIVSSDGSDLAKPENRKEFMSSIRSGKKVGLSVRRQNQTIEFQILPEKNDMFAAYAIGHALADEMITGKRVSIALVVTGINFTGTFPSSEAAAGWKAGMKAGVETSWESDLIAASGKRCGNYSVVDRSKTNEILGELHFQMTGAVDSSMMKTVGKMSGATHLLFVSVTRYGDGGNGWKDETDLRLVDLESGNLLATARKEDKVR